MTSKFLNNPECLFFNHDYATSLLPIPDLIGIFLHIFENKEHIKMATPSNTAYIKKLVKIVYEKERQS